MIKAIAHSFAESLVSMLANVNRPYTFAHTAPQAPASETQKAA